MLATLGIRYLRLDQVGLVDGVDRLRAAADPAARLLHDEAALAMSPREAHCATSATETEAAADRHPGAAVDADPDLPHVPVRDLAQGRGLLGPALADQSDAAATSRWCSARSTTSSIISGCRCWNSVVISVGTAAITLFVATAAAFAISRLQREGRPHGDEPGAVHLFHPGRVPRGADVQDHGHVRAAEQRLGAGAGDGDHRLALRDLDPAARRRTSCRSSSTRPP